MTFLDNDQVSICYLLRACAGEQFAVNHGKCMRRDPEAMYIGYRAKRLILPHPQGCINPDGLSSAGNSVMLCSLAVWCCCAGHATMVYTTKYVDTRMVGRLRFALRPPPRPQAAGTGMVRRAPARGSEHLDISFAMCSLTREETQTQTED